jgi:hypothetical protein
VLDDAAVSRALVITAHPDDVDFGAAGTVALWTDAGIDVSYCVITDGDAGGFDPDVPRDEIGGIRQEEQRAAAKIVGVSDVVFLGYPDGRLEVSLDLRRDLARVIRRVRPDRVICQSALRNMVRIPASLITWPRARQRCARSTRTPATRSHSRKSSAISRPGRFARLG